MIEWMRFALIVSVAAVDNVVSETVLSFGITRDLIRDRLRWQTFRRKLRRLLVGRR